MRTTLGSVLHWFGCIVAVLCVALGVWIWAIDNPGAANAAALIAYSLVGGIAWVTGWACRYVLSGI